VLGAGGKHDDSSVVHMPVLQVMISVVSVARSEPWAVPLVGKARARGEEGGRDDGVFHAPRAQMRLPVTGAPTHSIEYNPKRTDPHTITAHNPATRGGATHVVVFTLSILKCNGLAGDAALMKPMVAARLGFSVVQLACEHL
jgi:hypothetical protein